MARAQELTVRLGGTWRGRYGNAPCPVCQPERRPDQNALTLRDGVRATLAHCKKSACRFGDILTAAGIVSGTYTAPDPARQAEHAAQMEAQARKSADHARQGWEEDRNRLARVV